MKLPVRIPATGRSVAGAPGGVRACRAAVLILFLGLSGPVLARGMFSGETLIEPCARTQTFAVPAAEGPYDYRRRDVGPSLSRVERAHFTTQVEHLIKGLTGTLAQEFSFMLHAWPNHHRALAALTRWSLRDKSAQPGGLDYSVDCYYQRAVRFRPDDNVVRMLYADFLSSTQRPDEAAKQLAEVRKTAGDNPLTHYNLGLLYLRIERYDEAREQAHRAQALGLERADLREALEAKGKWGPPPPAEVEAAASASTATSAALAASEARN